MHDMDLVAFIRVQGSLLQQHLDDLIADIEAMAERPRVTRSGGNVRFDGSELEFYAIRMRLIMEPVLIKEAAEVLGQIAPGMDEEVRDLFEHAIEVMTQAGDHPDGRYAALVERNKLVMLTTKDDYIRTAAQQLANDLELAVDSQVVNRPRMSAGPVQDHSELAHQAQQRGVSPASVQLDL